MKFRPYPIVLTVALMATASSAVGQPGAGGPVLPDSIGTGPYPAMKEVDPGLPDQVVYRPADLDALGSLKLGVYAFGNGACSDDAASARQHLLEIASHGYIAISPGGIYSGPGASPRPAGSGGPRDPAADSPTHPEQLRQAIGWILAENERAGSPYFNRIDTDAIAASGFSCGGIQALYIAGDQRVETVIVMNSGLFQQDVTNMGGMSVPKSQLYELHSPTLYVLGGPTDIAYENGMHDFATITHVPIAVANLDVGHGGTYAEPNGGAAAAVVVDWLQWRLRGDAEAGKTFFGEDCGLCTDSEWTYDSKALLD